MSCLETIEQYFSRVTDIINRMRVYGEEIPDNQVVEKILCIMLIKFNHVMTTILESHNTNTAMIAEL